MTPSYLNLSSSYVGHKEDESLSANYSEASLSANSLTCHLFFNPLTTHDHDEVFKGDQSHLSQNEDENFGSQASDDHCVDNHDDQGGLQFSLWKRENYDHMNKGNQVKWMSSKMRVMLKMKKVENTLQSTSRELKLEDHHDQKEQVSSPMEQTSKSINIDTSSNNYTKIRVCSDCNTTNTPLWRSGPQGPKSLCNACGIRQRKARKAMEAARAEAPETGKRVINDRPKSLKATKTMHKVHKKPKEGHVRKYKNRQYSSSSSSAGRKNCVEEFLVSLKKRLESHGVFSQEEMEAAILLMALSCGYVYDQ